jgi:N6-adenosine-specific RNA methylase IME4
MIQIKEEFRKLIPALTAEEFKQLEQNCLNEGIRDSIVLWNDFIIDGHNRYQIAMKHQLQFECIDMAFDSEDDVVVWMIDNQDGRRNLTDGWKYKLQQIKKVILLKKGKEKQIEAGKIYGENHKKEEVLSTIDKSSHDTRKEIAKALDWSTGKVAMADIVFKKATPELEEKVLNNEVTINQAYQEIKKEEKKEIHIEKKKEYEQRIETVTNNEFKIDIFNTLNKFRVIYADPAWSYNDKQDTPQLGGAAKHYDTMSVSQICNLPVNEISEKDSVLFLWVTSPLLEDAFTVIKSWGFKYKTSFVWDKIKHNMGHYNSVRHEFLLIATKGSCTPDNKKLYDSVQAIERNNNHSEKPIEFLNIIDDIYNYGNKLEMFCRNIKKEKWYGWGNEI